MAISNMVNGIHKATTIEIFRNAPRKDQNDMLQNLYDQGYSGKELADFFGIGSQAVYNRIDAHRGRSGKPFMA